MEEELDKEIRKRVPEHIADKIIVVVVNKTPDFIEVTPVDLSAYPDGWTCQSCWEAYEPDVVPIITGDGTICEECVKEDE